MGAREGMKAAAERVGRARHEIGEARKLLEAEAPAKAPMLDQVAQRLEATEGGLAEPERYPEPAEN